MKRKFEVFVVVRHTRSGDNRVCVLDNREQAMSTAEDVADEAATNYGYGSTSVFKGTLMLKGTALQPKAGK